MIKIMLNRRPSLWLDCFTAALKRAKAQFVLAAESVTGQGQMLGMAEAVAGDYHWYENTLEALGQITLDDLMRVQKTYLQADNCTVGLYKPAGNGLGQ